MTNERKRRTASDIAAKMRREIATSKYFPHDCLPSERQLAERFRVARGTIRNALKKLESEGLVNTKSGSGTYVLGGSGIATASPIALTTPMALIDTRFALEPYICHLAALRGRQTDFEHLEDLCQRMEDSVGNHKAHAITDSLFHRTLVECTRNSMLVWMMEQVSKTREQDEWIRVQQLTLNNRVVEQYNKQHRELLCALQSRDADCAAQLMRDHLETVRLLVRRIGSGSSTLVADCKSR